MKDDLEPANLPEERLGFQKDILLVTVRGEVKLYDGWLAGISTLHRTGDGHIVKTTGSSSTGCLVTLDAHLGLSSIVGHYKAHAKFMNLGPTFELMISIPTISFAISLKQDVNQDGSRPDLAFLDIENIGEVGIIVNGYLGPLDWILSKVYSVVGNIVKGFVANLLQKPIRKMLSEELRNSNITLDEFGCGKL